MKSYKAYCFDLDGTVYRGKNAIESAVRFIHKLQMEKLEYFFVTNNSSKTPEQLQKVLADINIETPTSRIYSSALTTAKYVDLHYKDANIFMIGSDGIRSALEAHGLNIIDTDEARPDVVVMGIDRTIDYMKLVKASLAVQSGAELIGTNEDIRFPAELGFIPGNGSFVHLVGNVAQAKPTFIGKPSPVMLEVIQQEYGFQKEEMVMIGDNYDTDILCGIRFGCDTIHVNTGVVSTELVLQKEQKPTFCVEDLSVF
ncbi:TIGR01457 family HAD-type hydrolase [Lysinibacillus yapensis]|uniref:TIGR01457 family HAD-type hydrolase n=1 Tax=Ureibacillus yapensis TaxID=2304605 RepID=A0A396SMH8_9BACL|nr:TIGR01457 family HAD-type hydrolase [Lysinibacillus yapensis]RHW36806.1 TIGR01457 family HAD-type hydrolase [Lysinibacillus yapensis]